MSPWAILNHKGKILLSFCVLNLIISVNFAIEGSFFCLFNFFCGMFCGLATLLPIYKK